MDEYLNAYVGKKYKTFYRNVWLNKQPNILFPSWNICAFLVGLCWCFYRKMYFIGAIYFFIICAVEIILKITGANAELYFLVSVIASFLIWLCNGILGNSLYYNKSVKDINRLNEKTSISAEVLKKKGGTSVLSVILIIVILFAESFFVQILFAGGFDTPLFRAIL